MIRRAPDLTRIAGPTGEEGLVEREKGEQAIAVAGAHHAQGPHFDRGAAPQGHARDQLLTDRVTAVEARTLADLAREGLRRRLTADRAHAALRLDESRLGDQVPGSFRSTAERISASMSSSLPPARMTAGIVLGVREQARPRLAVRGEADAITHVPQNGLVTEGDHAHAPGPSR